MESAKTDTCMCKINHIIPQCNRDPKYKITVFHTNTELKGVNDYITNIGVEFLNFFVEYCIGCRAITKGHSPPIAKLANLVLETRMHAFHEDIQCLVRKRGTDEYSQ